MPTVKIRSVGEKGVIIHKFLSEAEARAYILGFREAITIPGTPEFKIYLDGKEI